jgi:uncharacterized protein (TIGR02391 family)
MLKKMFLKALWESTRPNGKLQGSGHAVSSIFHRYQSTAAALFELPNLDSNVRSQWSLTEHEWKLGLECIEELQRDSFIKNDPDQGNPDFKALTDKGRQSVEKELENMQLPSVDIDAVLSRQDLADKVREDYLDGEYDKAVREAMVMVEVAVRTKAQLATAFGANLMRTAFTQPGSRLTHPDAHNQGQHDALLNLFLGTNGWYRNPIAHGPVGYSDPHQVAQILGLANLLLDLVDKCV